MALVLGPRGGLGLHRAGVRRCCARAAGTAGPALAAGLRDQPDALSLGFQHAPARGAFPGPLAE